METEPEDTTTTENENRLISAIVRIAVALLWLCPKCGRYNVTKHLDATVTTNFANGSKVAPLRGTCEHCKKTTRLRSEVFDHVRAEVSWRRVRERHNLIVVAEGLNMLDGTPTVKQMYDTYNSTVGYEGKKKMPMPFKRWLNRGA